MKRVDFPAQATFDDTRGYLSFHQKWATSASHPGQCDQSNVDFLWSTACLMENHYGKIHNYEKNVFHGKQPNNELEHHHSSCENSLSMAMFNSYVSHSQRIHMVSESKRYTIFWQFKPCLRIPLIIKFRI